MKWARVALLAAAVAAAASGCGTVFNLASKDPDNYGGVQRDIQVAADASAHGGLLSEGTNRSGAGSGEAALVVLALCGAELSLSFVGDTLTLPLVIYLRQRHEGALGGEGASANQTSSPH
jgi:uncharacterized protein YceK